jgi:predicted nucleotidyltransferase
MAIDRQNIEAVLPREATAAFCAAWGVAELYVFGSAARGALEPSSDIDIAVRFRPGVRYSLFDLVDMKEELARISGRPVDLFTLRGIEHMANAERRRAILDSLELVHAA